MSNCPTCMDFVPKEKSRYGCYCQLLKRPIFYDENESIWFYISLGWRKLEGSILIANKNIIPYQISNHQLIRERKTIENCPNWRSILNETHSRENIRV